jgi:hypothetical protein
MRPSYHDVGAYVIEVARPKLGSSGFGGTGSLVPGISCGTDSLEAHAVSWSTMTSWVFGPAATRKCFSIMRQYSSAQSCLENFANEEDGDVLLLRRLRVKVT